MSNSRTFFGKKKIQTRDSSSTTMISSRRTSISPSSSVSSSIVHPSTSASVFPSMMTPLRPRAAATTVWVPRRTSMSPPASPSLSSSSLPLYKPVTSIRNVSWMPKKTPMSTTIPSPFSPSCSANPDVQSTETAKDYSEEVERKSMEHTVEPEKPVLEVLHIVDQITDTQQITLPVNIDEKVHEPQNAPEKKDEDKVPKIVEEKVSPDAQPIGGLLRSLGDNIIDNISGLESQAMCLVQKKRCLDNEFAAVFKILQSFGSKYDKLDARLRSLMSNLTTITEASKQLTEERDELKMQVLQIKEAKQKSYSTNFEYLRAAIERVHDQILQSANLFLNVCFNNPRHPMLRMSSLFSEELREAFIQSVLCENMFFGFENESFLLNDGASLEQLDARVLKNELMENFHELVWKTTKDVMEGDNLFKQFSSDRTARVMKEIRKRLLVGSSDLSKISIEGGMDEKLGDLAKEVWCLHKLVLAMEPRVRILRAPKRAAFDEEWMEAGNVFSSDGIEAEEKTKMKKVVELMVMPGFQFGGRLMSPCRVYIV